MARLMQSEAKYLVTPLGGRVGKARQVQPFQITAGERHGDIDEIEHQIEKSITKYTKNRNTVVIVQMTATAGKHSAYAVVNSNRVGVFDVEAIEKD